MCLDVQNSSQTIAQYGLIGELGQRERWKGKEKEGSSQLVTWLEHEGHHTARGQMDAGLSRPFAQLLRGSSRPCALPCLLSDHSQMCPEAAAIQVILKRQQSNLRVAIRQCRRLHAPFHLTTCARGTVRCAYGIVHPRATGKT
jgi:hypothetical protein